MSQESLDFGRIYRVADGARALYRAMNDAIDVVGILPAAGACGVNRSDLRRALDRDERRVAVEHSMSIGALADYDTRKRMVAAYADTLGFSVCDAAPPLTDAERSTRLEAALRALGPIGEAAARAALGGSR
jgi:hypothetical protein